MATLTIQIGNSDDELTQKEWAAYIGDVELLIDDYAPEVHFRGGALPNAPWQNYCWVIVAHPIKLDYHNFLRNLEQCRKAYKQNSIAITLGETQFI